MGKRRSQWAVKDAAASEPPAKVAKTAKPEPPKPKSRDGQKAVAVKPKAAKSPAPAPVADKEPAAAEESPYELFIKASNSSNKEETAQLLQAAVNVLDSGKRGGRIVRLLSLKLNKAYLHYRALCALAAIKPHSEAKPLLKRAAEAFPFGIQSYESLGNITLFAADAPEALKDAVALLDRAVELGRDLAAGASSSEAQAALENSDDPDELEVELEDCEQHEITYASMAAQKLALIYAANATELDAKGKKARKLLYGLNYVYRLGQGVLEYPLPPPKSALPGSADAKPYVRALDGVLPEAALEFLSSLFAPSSDFWSSHDYNPFVSNGYFSYLQKLPSGGKDGAGEPKTMFEAIVLHLASVVARLFPHLSKRKITTAEWWAHSRPHCSGHQLHFDSENEGITPLSEAEAQSKSKVAPRHPVVSCVIYLSDEDVGGPTLVTTQTLTSKSLDPVKGWLAYGKRGRIAFFDANYLHGVIPGRGTVPDAGNRRRTTFMIGFWDKVTAQTPRADGKLGGASQAFPPKAAPEGLKWIETIQTTKPVNMPTLDLAKAERPALPVQGKVWEQVEQEARLPKGLIPYEDCFQGF